VLLDDRHVWLSLCFGLDVAGSLRRFVCRSVLVAKTVLLFGDAVDAGELCAVHVRRRGV
jgi:hypothetical protein